jgi:glutathione synthase/RimK-type ligase-like ATP-grasp enzyme
MSKPYQAQFITSVGFLTPRTLITNDPNAVREFKRENGQIIFKSISSIRSIVREFEGSYTTHTERIRFLPTQFQKFIQGTNIRVHVIGDRIFATKVNTEAVDYRYAGRDGLDVDMESYQLPDSERERCLSLSRILRLPLCGIDLKLTPAGEYYCFEVNPSPAYSYYQEHSGQPIAEAIIDYLVGE